MHPVANLLIQLQELTLIRDEQKVVAGGLHLEQLDASIRAMARELPPDIRLQFEKLQKRDRVAIVSTSDGTCAACGMKLAISHVQAVRQAKSVLACPNCARLLYYLDEPPRRIGKAPRRTAPSKTGVHRFSSETLMVPSLVSQDKEDAIRELATKMEEEGFVDKADKLVEAALQREAILSTAVDHGLAFPHVRGVEGGGLTFALGISRKGIHFEGHSRLLTRMIFFIVIPTAASAFYLKLLAGLTETFMHAEARKVLMAETEPLPMWKALVKATRPAIK